MRFQNNSALRSMLNGFPDLTEAEEFNISRMDFDKHLDESKRQHQEETVDQLVNRAVYRCLTLDRTIPPVARTEKSPAGGCNFTDAAIVAGLNSIASEISALHSDFKSEWNNAALRRKKAFRAGIAIAVIITLVFSVHAAYGQNVNANTVVAVCGTPPTGYPAAGQRAQDTVDVNGQKCATAAVTVTPPANQNVTIIAMNNGVFPITTAGQSYGNAMAVQGVTNGIAVPVTFTAGAASSTVTANQGTSGSQGWLVQGIAGGVGVAITGQGAAGTSYPSQALTIQGVTGGLAVPVSPLNDTVRIGGIASGLTIPTSGANDTVRIGGIASGLTLPVSTSGPLTITGTSAPGIAAPQALTIQGSSSGVPLPLSIPQANAGTNQVTALGVQGTTSGRPLTIQGALVSTMFASTLNATIQTILSAAGTLESYHCVNTDATNWAYVQLLDASSPTIGVTVPKAPLGIPPASGGNLSQMAWSFTTAIKVAATTTPAGSTNAVTALTCTFGYIPNTSR